MIHYHGAMNNTDDATRFYIGRHALVSFAADADLPAVADSAQSFCLDSGAFTVWRKGGTLDIVGYEKLVIDWCKHPGFDFALIPDVIDGSESANDDLINNWRDADLRRYGVPVWHLHESLDRLRKLADEWRTVALGSSGQWAMPGAAGWWRRMSEAMGAICDDAGRPMCRLHGLRMLDPMIFSRLPLASADSANAAINSGALKRYGMYPAPNRYRRAQVIADRIEAYNSASVWIEFAQQELELCG